MIGHQAIGVEIERKFCFLILERGGESQVVVMRPENLPAVVAARDDVIEGSTDFDSGFPGHDAADATAGKW